MLSFPSLRGIGFQNRNFGGFFQGKDIPKTIFCRNGQANGIISGKAFSEKPGPAQG
jgi:hypothetical protein